MSIYISGKDFRNFRKRVIMTDKQSNCKYVDEFGNCEIAKIACKKVFICSEDGIYIDKEDVNNDR